MKITVELQAHEVRELLSFRTIQPPVRTESVKIPTKEIREWARSKGLAVAKGGTLPKDVIEAYYQDNGGF